MSSIFKKIGKGVTNIFKKAPSVTTSIFKKVGDVASQVSGGLAKVGDVLGNVADVGGQILANPLVDMAGSAVFGPEFGVASNLVGRGLQGVAKASDIAKRGSQIAGMAGSASRAAQGGDYAGALAQGRAGIQKAQELRRDAGVDGPMFA